MQTTTRIIITTLFSALAAGPALADHGHRDRDGHRGKGHQQERHYDKHHGDKAFDRRHQRRHDDRAHRHHDRRHGDHAHRHHDRRRSTTIDELRSYQLRAKTATHATGRPAHSA